MQQGQAETRAQMVKCGQHSHHRHCSHSAFHRGWLCCWAYRGLVWLFHNLRNTAAVSQVIAAMHNKLQFGFGHLPVDRHAVHPGTQHCMQMCLIGFAVLQAKQP